MSPNSYLAKSEVVPAVLRLFSNHQYVSWLTIRFSPDFLSLTQISLNSFNGLLMEAASRLLAGADEGWRQGCCIVGQLVIQLFGHWVSRTLLVGPSCLTVGVEIPVITFYCLP